MVLLIQYGTLTNDKVAEAIRATFERRKRTRRRMHFRCLPLSGKNRMRHLLASAGYPGRLKMRSLSCESS
jgi:hypothetical protein